MSNQYLNINESLAHEILAEADRREADNEDLDPIGILANHLRAGKPVLRLKAEAMWRLHQEGPWRLSMQEFQWLQDLCRESGNPYREPNWQCPAGCAGLTEVAMGDFGDCILWAAARGKDAAVWSRKGRLYIGFRNESDAARFRAIRPEWSLEGTGNRHVALVVLEGLAPFDVPWEPKSDREALTGQYCDLDEIHIPVQGRQALEDLGQLGIKLPFVKAD